MTSAAKAVANRQNAQLSTGPRTEEGKAISSRNSIRHGLTGTQIVMPGEDAAAYEELRKGMHDAYQPANEPERVLVDQVAANSWRLLRAQRVETAFLKKLAEGADDPDMAIAEAFLEKPKELARIHRYVTTASNAYYKAMKELTKLQKERADAEYEEAVRKAQAEAIGFVSKSAPSPEIAPLTAPISAPVSDSVSEPRLQGAVSSVPRAA